MSQKTVSLRNTVIAIVIVAIIAGASTYSLGTSMTAPKTVTVQQTQVSTAAATPLKLCGSLHLTGERSSDSVLVRNAYLLWANNLNANGGLLGRPLNVIIYDDGSSADRSVSNYQRCVSIDHADLLLGSDGSWDVYAVIVVSEQNHMVFISPAGGAPKIFADRKPQYYFFAQPARADLQIRAMFEFINSLPAAQQPKTIALSMANDVFGQGIHDRGVEYATAQNLKIVYDQFFPAGQPDYSSFALAVKQANPDFFFNGAADEQDGTNWLKAMKQVGLRPPDGVWMAQSDQAWVNTLGGLGENLFGNLEWTESSKTYQNDLLQSLWKQTYNTSVPEPAVEGWASVQVLEQAIEATKSFNNDVLAQYIHNNTFNTIYGPGLKFDQHGVPLGDFMLSQVQGGTIQIVYPTSVATATAVWPAQPPGSPAPTVQIVTPTVSKPE